VLEQAELLSGAWADKGGRWFGLTAGAVRETGNIVAPIAEAWNADAS
jgi:hypothetical protein